METEFEKLVPRGEFENQLHFSFSQLNTYLICPAKYGHSYVWGTPWETRPVALPFGKAIHRAAETYYRNLKDTGEIIPVDLIKSPKASKPEINPLSMEEVNLLLEHVHPGYKNFFTVAFFTGMRFGEICVLKWRNVDFAHGVIKVRETRVNGEELPPKTSRSIRDINMLAPVIEALREQRKRSMGKSEYVFLNQNGRPLSVKWVHSYIWRPALDAAGLKRRRLYETRHTFATLMLDAGELPGWVQKMMGHETLQMIHERYYSYIKNYRRADGSAFMEKVYKPCAEAGKATPEEKSRGEKFTPNLHQEEKRELPLKGNSLT
jgi:integrase